MINAVGNRLVVKEIIAERKAGTLILTNEGDKQINARVIAKGSDVDDHVDIDHIVVIRKMGGMPFTLDGEEYLSVVQHEVIAVTDGISL